MPEPVLALSNSEPDPAVLQQLAWVKRASLAVAALIALATLAAWLIYPLGQILPEGWRLMKANSALCIFFGTLALHFSEPRQSKRRHLLSQLLALVVALCGIATLVEYSFHISLGIDAFLAQDFGSTYRFPGRMAPQTAAAFAILGLALIPIQAQSRIGAWLADLAVSCNCFVILVLVSGHIFGAMRIFGISSTVQTSPQTMICLVLLSTVAVFRRGENGIYSIFLGRGIGSRIARTLAPILLVISFFREAGRAHMIQVLHLPEQYTTAILASVATAVSFALLLLLTWRITRMEKEIRDLSLRDELTGLHNLRGFQVLAEQALRLAQRSQLPLSVLFIDLDNLKEINDSLGHGTGSAILVETGELIKGIFRESDIVGRIGGDEFAVVCQCDKVAMAIACGRLVDASVARNSGAGRRFPFSFSMGYVTSNGHTHLSLQELLAQADKAMYEEKRQKKITRS
jgi:diguanylate cyclase (GGDEF)-like protein